MRELGQWTLLVYGVLMVVGGIIGYANAKSVISLVSGIASGIVLFIAYGVARSQPKAGLALGVVVTLLLAVSFVMRFRKTGKFMPSGLLLIVSVVALILLGAAALQGNG